MNVWHDPLLIQLIIPSFFLKFICKQFIPQPKKRQAKQCWNFVVEKHSENVKSLVIIQLDRRDGNMFANFCS